MIAGILLLAATPPALELDATSPFVDVLIKGRPARLRVDFGASGYVILNRSSARRLGFRQDSQLLKNLFGLGGGGFLTTQVGPVSVDGTWAEAALKIAGRRVQARVAWFPREQRFDSDGVISPALLPYGTVRLSRGDAGQASMRATSLPARFDAWHGLYTPSRLGPRTLQVHFSFDSDETVATAAAGAYLADTLGGALSGPMARVPVSLGVERPMRRLHLARPLVLGSISLDETWLRVADWAGKTELPRDAEAPLDEIRVMYRHRQREWAKLTLGREALTGCSSIAYDAGEQQLTLSCQ